MKSSREAAPISLERIVKHSRQLSEYQESRNGFIEGMYRVLQAAPVRVVERAVAQVLFDDLAIQAREDRVRTAELEGDAYAAHNRVQRQMLLRDLQVWLATNPDEPAKSHPEEVLSHG